MRASAARARKPPAASTVLPVAATSCSSGAKAAPPKPSSTKYVACHSGEKDASGRLKAFKDAPAWFRPSLTPREMLLKGMHGGIYFNPKGGKPGVKYPRSKYPNGIPGVTLDEFPKEWFDGVPPELYKSRRYDAKRNCYAVKSGLDQVGWETSGWINECDPRGWTQWYFRFFMGRRLAGGEDERQMGRWNGVCGDKGRWKQNLIAKCLRDGKGHDDASVSPVVRQTLLHWAYELTEVDFGSGAKRVKTHGAAYVPTMQLAGVVVKRGGGAAAAASVDDDAEATASEKAARGSEDRAARAKRRAEGDGATVKAEDGEEAAAPPAAKRARGAQPRARAQRSAAVAGELSAYEQRRDEQRAANEKKLAELGLA